jgi:hypothetical protein
MSEQQPASSDPDNPQIGYLDYAEKPDRQKITGYLASYVPDYEVRPGEEGRVTDPHLAEEMAYAEKNQTEKTVQVRNVLRQIEPEEGIDLEENVNIGDAVPRNETHEDVGKSILKLRAIADKSEYWANQRAVQAAVKYIDQQKK